MVLGVSDFGLGGMIKRDRERERERERERDFLSYVILLQIPCHWKMITLILQVICDFRIILERVRI